MRIIYNAAKGKRYKKGTAKIKNRSRRLNIFSSIECSNDYWWSESKKKWIQYDEWNNDGNICTSCYDVKNVKQLIRHMKKHSKYLPKGIKFILKSNFIGINNIIGLL